MPAGSTSIRRRNPPSTQDLLRLRSSVGRVFFFSFVQRIGGGDPSLGSEPSHSQKARQGAPDGFARDSPLGKPLLKAHLCRHLQSPQATVVPELPRRAVEHLPQSLDALFVESGVDAPGARGSGREGEKAAIVEGVDGVSDRLRATSQTQGDLRRREPARACQKYLASAHYESVFGAQSCFEALALVFRKRTYKDRRFHKDHYSSSHTTLSEDALGPSSSRSGRCSAGIVRPIEWAFGLRTRRCRRCWRGSRIRNLPYRTSGVPLRVWRREGTSRPRSSCLTSSSSFQARSSTITFRPPRHPITCQREPQRRTSWGESGVSPSSARCTCPRVGPAWRIWPLLRSGISGLSMMVKKSCLLGRRNLTRYER